MKTILFVSPTGTFDNGAEVSIFNLMSYLNKMGHRVINVAPGSLANNQERYEKKFTDQGMQVYFLRTLKWWWEEAPSGLAGSEGERLFYYRNNVNEIRKLIEEKEIDIVITNTVNVFQGALAAALTEIPHIWLIHEFPRGEFEYYLEKFPFISENSDALFSVRGNLNTELKQLFPTERIGDFYPFTEVEISSLKNGQKRRIVSVGRLTEGKNQLELIQAFEKIADNDLELVFIGGWDIDYKKKIDQYIRDRQLKRVAFTGGVDNPWELVTDQDICVFPSKMETFGLVYVEALIRGVPVVLSNNPGHQTAFGIFEFGEMYTVGDIDQLVNKIRDVLKNFEQNSRDAQAFSVTAQKLYQVDMAYKNILEFIDSPTYKDKSVKAIERLVMDNGKVMSKNRYYLKFRSVAAKVYHRLLKR